MISYVKGPLMAIEEDVIVVEAGHVGLAKIGRAHV